MGVSGWSYTFFFPRAWMIATLNPCRLNPKGRALFQRGRAEPTPLCKDLSLDGWIHAIDVDSSVAIG